MTSRTTTQPVYDESKVKSLSSLEHIRTRSGMYIGRTGDGSSYEDGIYVLLKEVIDNSIDEFIMGHGQVIEIGIDYATGRVKVRDYGRGIPLGKVVECVSNINTGAKYDTEVFQFSVGLNGIGTKAVNALSTSFLVRSHRDGEFVEATFDHGVLLDKKGGRCEGTRNGTYVEFVPDPTIFRNYAFREEHVLHRIRFYTYLNAGLSFRHNGQPIRSEGGLHDLIVEESAFDKLYEPLHHRETTLELAFTHTNRYSEQYYSFVNGQYTTDGGTHLSAFREGFLKGINEYANQRFDGDDVRDGVVAAIAIRLKDPMFESQTKNRLGNSDIRADLVTKIKSVVTDLLHRNAREAATLIEKIVDTQKLRKELQTVKKLARERSKDVSIRVPQLKDCKTHYNARTGKGGDSMLFITEGQSAAGSIVSCRNPVTQAIFTLKGKPLNVWDLKRDALYKNTEIYNLMRSLNIEETIENLRYNHVVLATDADVDGLHIRNLMITFFLRYFEPLVRQGHLKILETPLFRVRNKKETIYCHSEGERDKAMTRIGKGAEVTRFKGLGEISPGEFKAFIGSTMRLTPVRIDEDDLVSELLSFYMGKNTPQRRDYIMTNLVMDTVEA